METSSKKLCEGTKLWLPKLLEGILISRVNRFVALIRLGDGQIIEAHCPNSGSMLTCSEPGRPVFVSEKANAKGRLKYTWELIDMGSSLVGINTNVPNKLVVNAISKGLIPELKGYVAPRQEVRFGAHRLDIMAVDARNRRLWIEVKNCTLVIDEVAYFPDAVTERGQRHLKALMELKAAGNEAAMVFVIQRGDAHAFKAAEFIDPKYVLLLKEAHLKGVKIFAFGCDVNTQYICIDKVLPVIV